MTVETCTCPRCQTEVPVFSSGNMAAERCPHCGASLEEAGRGSEPSQADSSIARACDGPKGKVILFIIPLAVFFSWWLLRDNGSQPGAARRMGPSDAAAPQTQVHLASAMKAMRPVAETDLSYDEATLSVRQSMPRTTAAPLPGSEPVPQLPELVSAELGMWVRGQFVVKDTFKSGEWLTIRVRTEKPCFLRVLYWPAKGDPLRLFPEGDGLEGRIPGGTNVLIPDPRKLTQTQTSHLPDASIFQLAFDPAANALRSDGAMVERVAVQISDEPFTESGSVRETGALYRSYPGMKLMEARVQGVTRLQGMPREEAMRVMEACLNQRTLPLSIVP